MVLQVALMESKQSAEGEEGQKTLQAALVQSRKDAGLDDIDDEEDLARAIQLSK